MSLPDKKYILHLSDLHMDNLEEDKCRRILDGAKEHPLAEAIYNDVMDNIASNPPIITVVSGDLTHEAEHGEFENARVFLISLLRQFNSNLTADSVLIVPGNHDIQWEKKEKGYSAENFKNFYLKFFKKEFESEPIEKKLLVNDNIVFYGLNSACKENEKHPGVGFISDQQMTWLQKDLRSNRSSYHNYIKIAVVHHHLLPVCNYKFDENDNKKTYSILTNADRVLQQLSTSNFSMVLHGHQHQYAHTVYKRYIKSPSDANQILSNPIAVIGSGTLQRESENSNKMYNIITIEDQKPPSYYFSLETRMSIYQKSQFYSTIKIPITITQYPTIIDSKEILDLALAADIGLIEVKDVFNKILSICLNIADLNNGFLGIYDKTIQRIRVVGISDSTPDNMKKVIVGDLYKIGQGITGHVFQEGDIYTTPNVVNDPLFSGKHKQLYSDHIKTDLVSCLAAPILNIDDSVCAIINVIKPRKDDKDNNVFSFEDEMLWRYLCNQIAPAINILVQKEQQKNDEKDLKLIMEIQERLDNDGSFKGKLDAILKLMWNSLELNESDGEAIAFVLQAEPNYYYTYSFIGFRKKLEYEKGQGLTGGLIEKEMPDFCLEHLKPGSCSKLGSASTTQCYSNEPSAEELGLSFFGYPMVVEDDCAGALVLNVVTPKGGTKETMSDLIYRYLRLLNIVSKLVMNKFGNKLILSNR